MWSACLAQLPEARVRGATEAEPPRNATDEPSPAACVSEVFSGRCCLQPVLFEGLEREAQVALLKYLVDDSRPQPEWTDEEKVLLHWRLLQELQGLEDPRAPLADKIDWIRWVYSSTEGDDKPFSFSNCVRVVASSPFAPVEQCIGADPEELRDWFRRRAKQWFMSTISQYPEWVQTEILTNATWVQEQLEKNPQWINEEIKRRAAQGDLFA
jgi:hypothetical protein